MTKMGGAWGQMRKLPDQVTETGGQSLSQRPLPHPPQPPGCRDSCSQDRDGTDHISPYRRLGLVAQFPSQLRTWESRTLVPSSLRPGCPGLQPLFPQGPSISFCPECVCSKKGIISPVDTFLHCGDMLDVGTCSSDEVTALL